MRTVFGKQKYFVPILMTGLIILMTHITSFDAVPAAGGICQVGDVIAPGESCTYPDTNTKFSVNANGTGQFLLLNVGSNLNLEDITINGVSYTLAAKKLANGSWEIEKIGTASGTTNTAPVFTDGVSTTRSVAENTAANTNIGTAITATDADNDTLTYTLGGTDAASFNIVNTTGQLQTKSALDYETKSSYTVTITVSDGNRGSDSITVTINVTDVNETIIIAPRFVPVADRTSEVRDAIVAAVPNVTDAAKVTKAQVAAITNLNLRNAGIAALKSGDFSGMTGLTTLNLFNNQLSSLPDGIFAGLTSLTTIRLGRNSVDPLPLTVSLEKVGTNQFKAVIPAGATFDIVLPITVINGSISGSATMLTISHGSMESGLLTVIRTPGTTADVTVDIGTLPSLPRNHFGYALVKSNALPLDIISGSNTAPVFTEGANTTRSVAENSAAGTHIGTAIAATDTENDTLTYTLSGADAASFDIDSSTGQLKTKAALDYETKTNYTVTLTVSDGHLTDTITVTINVTDVDEVVPVDPPTTPEPPPTTNSAPAFYEGGSTTRVVPENTPTGTNIGNAVLATDADNDFLGYTLGGTDADAFDMDSSGQLKTKAPLDYETKRVYLVTITVEAEELSSTITVIISVIDVNDTVPNVGFVPVADRTPEVRDAIVTAVPNVTAAADVTESQVAAITNLNLRNKGISKLKIGDFSGMTSLSNLNLFGNQLPSLPAGTFDGLTALSILRLSRNAVDPLPLIVSLKQTGNNTFKAIIPTGAPFNIELPLTVTGGSISGGITAVTIPQGTMESTSFTLIGTAAEVSFGAFPGVPRNHFGYELVQSTVCNRTTEVAAAIAKAVDVNDCSSVTELDLATITSLDLSGKSIASLSAADFDGMLSLRTLSLSNNDIESLPSGIFDDLVSLRELRLNSNKLTTVPGSIFSNLTSLTSLYLQSNDLSSLPSDAFDGLSALSSINLQSNDLTSLPGDVFDGTPYLSSILLSNNKMTSIPNGIFEGLTQLSQLHLSWNPNPSSQLALTVSLQKVGTNQLKAVAPSGAPFAIVVPISVKNGTLAGRATALRIPIGTVESLPITVTRTAGTTDAVTANIGTLPNRPSLHNGYALAKGTGLPLEILPPANSPPIFTDGATTTRTVDENTVANANIGTAIAATDINKDKLTYTLGGTDAAAFSIDSATGQLKTKAVLDYETKNSYSVTLTVSDGKLNDVITVTINVSNVNEAPTFTDGSSVTREIAENTSAGENIGTVITATDPDKDTLTYSLGGTDASAFALGTTTGQLRTKTALDYETKSLYTLVLTASDGNLTDTIAVTINVTDVEERSEQQVVEGENSTNNAPVFPMFIAGVSISRSVAENTGSGVDIGTPVAATDVDGDTLTYTLGGTDAAAFSIGSATGQLKTKAPLDYETKFTYKVTVTVSDGSLTDTITVTINVTDIDESAQNSAPVFTAGTSTTRSIAENTGIGVNIGAAISATDADGNTLVYSLGGTDAASFRIVSSSGQLQTNVALDYETKSTYKVTVTVSDGSLTGTITVTINITSTTKTTTITPVNERTQQVQDVIVWSVQATLAYRGVNNAYDITADDVTVEHLAEINTLNLDSKSISSLKAGDFDGLTALTRLWLGGNSISDISVLEKVTSLTELWLSDNSISDISALENLTSLESLHLWRNSISDISALENLTSLKSLHLTSNSVNDISALKNLTSLEWLHLEGNSISDISALENLTALTWLNLNLNSISDISALKNMTSMTDLRLSRNSISDISALENMTALTWLYLHGNSVSDISALENLTALTKLWLGGNSISDISALENLTSLTELRLGGNSISDISALENLTALTKLWLSRNSISDISALENLTALTALFLSGNPISDYMPLRRLYEAIKLKRSNPYIQLDVPIPAADNSGAPSQSTVPETTALLANFPNPFNPETWIPYQLATPSEVTITIYDIRGRVMRVLVLGHQAAGIYRSRSKAAHWDGRNHFGEKVATGVYFYTLKAGEYSATRKMLIRK